MHTPDPPRDTWSLNADLPAGSGGGLAGVASTLALTGRPLIEALARLRGRGNGRGGGVALAGCFPALQDHFAFNVALRARHLRAEVESAFVTPFFDITDAEFQPEAGDYREFPGLVERPPVVVRYFVRARPDALADFMARHGFTEAGDAEAAFVAQIAVRLTGASYTGASAWRAFVLSHGRDMLALKGGGYADEIARYYRLDEMQAMVWLGHQAYATRTHPGGAHPFALHDGALALCGEVVNRAGLATYVRQRGYLPQFASDGELAAMLFDFYTRACAYPLDLALEAMLPTSPAGLDRLLPPQRDLYRALHQAHSHGTPEGPAFFAVARRLHAARAWQLVAAVDALATRPHAFGLQAGVLWDGVPYAIGAVASERQAVEAVFEAVAAEQSAVCPIPDLVWYAKGDPDDAGGYGFTVAEGNGDAAPTLTCTDRRGRAMTTDGAQTSRDDPGAPSIAVSAPALTARAPLDADHVEAVAADACAFLRACSFAALAGWLDDLAAHAADDPARRGPAVALLTRLYDRKVDTGAKKRAAVRALLRDALYVLFNAILTDPDAAPPGDLDRRLTWVTLATRGVPPATDGFLGIDAAHLPPEGPDTAARVVIRAHRAGWRRLVVFGCKGDRFIGAGLGLSAGLRIDIYGTPGDYLAAGLDGAEIHVHGPAQDYTGRGMVGGLLVIHGDVGQGLLFGAAGGAVYVQGAAGARAFVQAGGALRVVVGGQYVALPGAGDDPDARRAALDQYAAHVGWPPNAGTFA